MPIASQITPVFFHFLQAGFSLSKRTVLKVFIEDVFKKEKKRLDHLHYIFCSDEYLGRINRDYLHHDTYTDIITFDLSKHKANAVSGEIYISIDRVKENALLFNTSFNKELHRVILHGVLHLCGYKDKTKSDKKVMSSREDFYLQKYFH
jgi:probable rRNA maturation factor